MSRPTVGSCLTDGAARLKAADIDQPHREARVLLAYALDVDQAAIIGHPRLARIEIQAHKDSRGADVFSHSPTQRRADNVRKFLVARGVDPARLESRGYGETKPIASNRTEEGRALNRRVEVVILAWGD